MACIYRSFRCTHFDRTYECILLLLPMLFDDFLLAMNMSKYAPRLPSYHRRLCEASARRVDPLLSCRSLRCTIMHKIRDLSVAAIDLSHNHAE
jgi:hypothetical protein